MPTERPNPAIPGDTTDQSHYLELKAQDRDLVDRAVYGMVIQRNQGNYQFTGNIVKNIQAANTGFGLLPKTAAGQSAPTSEQIEQKIERLREDYASKLLARVPNTRHELEDAAAKAPGGPESRRALNAIIAFNGDECGCSLSAPPVTPTVLTRIMAAAKPPSQTR